ncbi:DUF2793 domain-containing protein [Pseudovibrio exalbescens]|uniref:DUF2793 domain-containing protein n=1 Tax=Pseudovibrio exalbescens TaxID=197461 RepID=UPI000C9AD6E7|nr:DUF2793 domain-containing protein [Pseudovibrio exalbescens]
MSSTQRLGLPFIASAQAQKHVTHNEALFQLDQLVSCAVESRSLSAPPAAPQAGVGYVLPDTASGEWAGHGDGLAFYLDDAWVFTEPVAGQLVLIKDESALVVRTHTGWQRVSVPIGLAEVLSVGAGGSGLAVGDGLPEEQLHVFGNSIVSSGPSKAASGFYVEEELVSGLSGAFADTVMTIPDRAIVLCVSTRTVGAVSGASSYDCGIAGERSKFGGMLGTSVGSTNAGVIGPQAFYAATPLRLSANGGDFSGGDVRVALHYYRPAVPQT